MDESSRCTNARPMVLSEEYLGTKGAVTQGLLHCSTTLCQYVENSSHGCPPIYPLEGDASAESLPSTCGP